MDYADLIIDKQKSKSYLEKLIDDPNIQINKEMRHQEIQKQQILYNALTNQELISLFINNQSCIHKALRLELYNRIGGSLNKFWRLLANIEYNVQNYQNYFDHLVKSNEFPNYFQDTIQRDVVRTTNNPEIQQKLSNVLNAYSRRNSQIGYCQGFNYIAHYLLDTHKMSEEEVFWFLCYLFECILPPNYYNHLLGILGDDMIIRRILQITKPKLMEHLQEIQVETSLFTIQWLVCCFTFHNKLSDVHLDLLLIEGSKAQIKSILAFINLMENTLMLTTDIGQFIMTLENFISTFQDRQIFLEEYKKIYINNRILQYFRQEICDNIIQQIQSGNKVNQFNIFLEDLKKEKCQLHYPICIYEIESWTRNKKHFDYIILKQQHINVIQNYQINQNIKKTSLKSKEDILIVRQEHICNKDDLFLMQILQYKDNHFITYNIEKQQNEQLSQSPLIKKKINNQISRSPFKEFLLLPIKQLDRYQQKQYNKINPHIYKISNALSQSYSLAVQIRSTKKLNYNLRGRSPEYKKMVMKSKYNNYCSPKRDEFSNLINQSTDVSQQPCITMLRETKSIKFLAGLAQTNNLLNIDFQ